jgi:hypothetical protein
MPSSAGVERKAPFYLIAALLASLGLGLEGGCDGYQILRFYRSSWPDISQLERELPDGTDRALVRAQFDRRFAAMDAAKERAFPLGAAALLVGLTLALFAARTLMGAEATRGRLLQLVIAQAAVALGTFAFEDDIRNAEHVFAAALIRMQSRVQLQDTVEAERVARVWIAAHRVYPFAYLVLRTLGSAVIVVALTRPRSRALLEGPDALSER